MTIRSRGKSNDFQKVLESHLPFEQFKADDKTYDAVVRNLEILGEAAKGLPDDVVQNKVPPMKASVDSFIEKYRKP